MFPAITNWAGDLPQPERIADVLRSACGQRSSGRARTRLSRHTGGLVRQAPPHRS